MKVALHLATCKTCQKVLEQLDLPADMKVQNIKEEAITEEQVDEMKRLAGSYEAVFSRRAMKFRQWGLNEKELSEEDYRKYILEEYTFLKRPVFIIDDKIFMGSSKKMIEELKESL